MGRAVRSWASWYARAVRARCISIATTTRPLLAAATEALHRQRIWREVAHHLLHHYPHIDEAPFNPRYAAFPWRRDDALLRAWQLGHTGIPIIDAGMRQLWQTGWMHNRVRMIVASFLVKNCRLHWLDGARWIWETLTDADLANNSFNWQWVAGCGADAAPYHRIFNPLLQAKKFDAGGRYVRRWLPELAALPDRWLHQPWRANTKTLSAAGLRIGIDYPATIVDLAQSSRQASPYRANSSHAACNPHDSLGPFWTHCVTN